ncbi:MAG: ABC transporter ATP-binding protein [Acidobacteria bacterium]|nr:MAG: ABC transporter ATP-binding protein [Acidobacteriota bacterium]
MKPESAAAGEPLVRAVGVGKSYRRGGREVVALRGVDLTIPRGATVALTGESGAGKSTLGRLLALAERPSSGEVEVAGRATSGLRAAARLALRRRLQLVPQDAAGTLSPRFSCLQAVAEPLAIAGWSRRRRRRRAAELLAEVALPAAVADRPALAASGGEKRRLVLARALACEPELLILDETFVGLDLSVQARLVNLLLELKERRRLTYLLISHDLSLVAHLADRVAVLAGGRLVEDRPRGGPQAIFRPLPPP